MRQVDELAREISVASQEQAQGVSEINKAMAQLDIVTQRNSTASDEAAGAADGLTEQAKVLRAAVSDLVLAIQGGEVETKTSSLPSPSRPAVVLPLVKAKPAIRTDFASVSRLPVKKAAGADAVPDRNHAGFSDV